MLTKLYFEKFRGFSEHTIPFEPLTVVIGQNNAGKSTIVEALRLVSLVIQRMKNLHFYPPPSWLTLPKVTRGVSPSLHNMEIDLRTSNHRYGEPPALIKAIFENGVSVQVYVGTDSIFATAYTANRKMIKSKVMASNVDLPDIQIMPQVAPLLKDESILTPEYIRRAMSSALAPLHFRNQLNVRYDLFPKFQKAVQETWDGLRVLSLDGQGKLPSANNTLSLFVQDEDFSAEASWMGHGLQMWLQTIWFLVRAEGADTVILDEPDVYMHADLQRKLIRYVQGKFPQVVVATHSTEIMSEVEPEQILIVNRRKSASGFASSLPVVQKVMESVGSVHNLQLARLWSTRRFLMVEGEDIVILKRFQDTLFPNSQAPLDAIPSMGIDGWGGWNYAIGSTMFLVNSVGEGIKAYCILDSDYHTLEEINQRYVDAEGRGVQLHVWQRKEIENYLLVPAAIQRVIVENIDDGKAPPSKEQVLHQLEQIAKDIEVEVFDNYSSELHKKNRGWDTGTANKKAREIVEKAFETYEGTVSVIPGKRVLSKLIEWSKQNFGVSFSVARLAREIRESEIAPEVKNVIQAIEQNLNFPGK